MNINKGVIAGPSGPSREGPGVGEKRASDTKQMIKGGKKKKKKKRGKGGNAKRKRKSRNKAQRGQ